MIQHHKIVITYCPKLDPFLNTYFKMQTTFLIKLSVLLAVNISSLPSISDNMLKSTSY